MDRIAIGIIIGMVFISLIMAFCVILIKLYFTKIKTYTSLLYQKDLDFQKSINTAIIETQEQVLNNISKDLHDDAGQQLTYINFQLENLKLDSAQLQHALQPISASVGQLSESIRGISHALNNQLILKQDLLKAIKVEIERLQKNPKIDFVYAIESDADKTFSTEEKVVIYRIFQEIVNNIIKHANASQVAVKVRTKPFFELQVTDNGKGFDVGQAQSKATLGLSNMSGRAEGIGYALKIISEPGNGTRVNLSENQTN